MLVISTGFNRRAVEYGDPRRNLPRCAIPNEPRRKPRFSKRDRNNIEKCKIKWLTPFQKTIDARYRWSSLIAILMPISPVPARSFSALKLAVKSPSDRQCLVGNDRGAHPGGNSPSRSDEIIETTLERRRHAPCRERELLAQLPVDGRWDRQ
jgi:hypothetical protein